MTISILVNSPFQVISAAEFLDARCRRGEGDDYDLVFVRWGSPANPAQTAVTAERLGLALRFIDDESSLPVFGKWRRFRLLRQEVGRLTKNDTLVIGNPAYIPFADLLARARCREKWVLDEGVASLRFLEPLAKGVTNWQMGHERGVGKAVNWLLLGCPRTPHWDRVRWFTMFAEHFPRLDNLERNTLELLRQRSQFARQADIVLFLGSPLVSGGMYEADVYDAWCRQAATFFRNTYPGCRVQYLRHRTEGDAEARVHRHFDSVEDSNGPVELRWMDRSGEFPCAVGGILSTALITLAGLLPDSARIHMFKPPPDARIVRKFRDPGSLFRVFEEIALRGRLSIEQLNGEPGASWPTEMK